MKRDKKIDVPLAIAAAIFTLAIYIWRNTWQIQERDGDYLVYRLNYIGGSVLLCSRPNRESRIYR